jgi:hypothetical protein
MAFTTTDAASAPALGSIDVACVEPSLIGTVWAEIAPDLGRALDEYFPMTLDECRRLCEGARIQLWTARQNGKIVGAAISEAVMQAPPRGLAIQFLITDYAANWSPQLAVTIEEWGEDLGATTFVVIGPPGMHPLLGKPITTYWRVIEKTPPLPMPSERVH